MNVRRFEDKCNRCMLCVKDCAAGVWRDINGEPTPFAPQLCNLCSHCIAVCPKGAIEHSLLDTSKVKPVRKKGLDSESYREIVMGRRSVREYKENPVPKEIIEDILDLAKYSPTASNTQNVQYTVVTDRELLKKVSRRVFGYAIKTNSFLKTRTGKLVKSAISKTNFGKTFGKYTAGIDYYIERAEKGKDYILHNAPVLILIHTPADSSFAADNCNISATNITNYAYSLGLGTCYIGFLTMALRHDKRLREMLKIPKDRKVHASLVLGYPAYRHSFTVYRKEPVVHWIESE